MAADETPGKPEEPPRKPAEMVSGPEGVPTLDYGRANRTIVLAAVVGGGSCLLAVIVGMTVLGIAETGVNEVATTGLASIGATLAGGFAGWIARGAATQQQDKPRAPRRRDDPL
jgi:hypothetical protein